MVVHRIRNVRGRRAAIAAGLVVSLVAGPVVTSRADAAESPRAEPPPTAPVPRLDWASCGAKKLKDFRCATAEVPTDYDHPHGRTTTIELTKLPASDPDRRIGSLFTNPGGPGGSGVSFVQTMGKQSYTSKVRARFDIIGFDPRAVAGSDPATCYANPKQEAKALAGIPAFPFRKRQERRFIADNLAMAEHCVKRSGDRIAHSSTANVARDMDLLRKSVGDKKLSYVGYSYGTYLGATYARLFPDRVRALVLDGTFDPRAYSGSNGDPRSIGARNGQGPAASGTYRQFLRLCADAGRKRCALAKLGKPRRVMEHTFRKLRRNPVTVDLPNGGSTTITYPWAVNTVFQSMYEPAGWRRLAKTFAYLARHRHDGGRTGPGEDVGRLVQRLVRTDYPSIGGSLASFCVDGTRPMKPRGYRALADEEDAKAPHFGRYRAWVGVQCERLGVDDSDAYTGPWRQEVDEPVLVIGTRYDPATPYRFTRPFTNAFPDGRMLTVEGWGHTILGKSACADHRVARYLVHGKARDGATCRPDSRPFARKGPGGERTVLKAGVPMSPL